MSLITQPANRSRERAQIVEIRLEKGKLPLVRSLITVHDFLWNSQFFDVIIIPKTRPKITQTRSNSIQNRFRFVFRCYWCWTIFMFSKERYFVIPIAYSEILWHHTKLTIVADSTGCPVKKTFCFFATQTVINFFLFIMFAFLFINCDHLGYSLKKIVHFSTWSPRYWNTREMTWRPLSVGKLFQIIWKFISENI